MQNLWGFQAIWQTKGESSFQPKLFFGQPEPIINGEFESMDEDFLKTKYFLKDVKVFEQKLVYNFEFANSLSLLKSGALKIVLSDVADVCSAYCGEESESITFDPTQVTENNFLFKYVTSVIDQWIIMGEPKSKPSCSVQIGLFDDGRIHFWVGFRCANMSNSSETELHLNVIKTIIAGLFKENLAKARKAIQCCISLHNLSEYGAFTNNEPIEKYLIRDYAELFAAFEEIFECEDDLFPAQTAPTPETNQNNAPNASSSNNYQQNNSPRASNSNNYQRPKEEPGMKSKNLSNFDYVKLVPGVRDFYSAYDNYNDGNVLGAFGNVVVGAITLGMFLWPIGRAAQAIYRAGTLVEKATLAAPALAFIQRQVCNGTRY